MKWDAVRAAYPNQWLVIEALEAHTTSNHQRQLDKIAVVEQCPDGRTAFEQCGKIHDQHPLREFYFVHTARETLDIEEVFVPGVRYHRTADRSR